MREILERLEDSQWETSRIERIAELTGESEFKIGGPGYYKHHLVAGAREMALLPFPNPPRVYTALIAFQHKTIGSDPTTEKVTILGDMWDILTESPDTPNEWVAAAIGQSGNLAVEILAGHVRDAVARHLTTDQEETKNGE